MTVAEKLKSWLDEIEADGLMYPDTGVQKHCWTVEQVFMIRALQMHHLVPAYRHADGTYHAEPECCVQCRKDHEGLCAVKWECCSLRKSWLAHKEEAK